MNPAAGSSPETIGLGEHTSEFIEVGVAAINLVRANGGREESRDKLGHWSRDKEAGSSWLYLEVGVHGGGLASDNGHQGLLEFLVSSRSLEVLVSVKGLPL